jgi:hypothetical protein
VDVRLLSTAVFKDRPMFAAVLFGEICGAEFNSDRLR